MFGGREICTYHFTKKLTKDHEVFFANAFHEGAEGDVKYVKFPALRLLPLIYSLITMIHLVYYIRKLGVDKLYIHDRLTVIPGVIAAKLTGRNASVTIMDYWFCCNQSTMYHDGFHCSGSLIDELRNYSIIRWPWEVHKYNAQLIGRYLLKKVKVYALSKYVKKVLKRYGIKSEVAYHHCPITNDYVKKAKKLNKYKGKDLVVFAGRLSKEKGVDVLIRAFKKVDKDALLVIAGSGPEEESLKRLADSDRMVFVGRISNQRVFDYYKTASVVVYPVLWDEPYGRVIAEVKQLGQSIIATRSGGITEQLINYDKGYLVNKGSVSELTKALNKVLK